MILYGKSSQDGVVIKNTLCQIDFHSGVWGLGVAFGKEQVGLGLAEHYDSFFRLTFLCFTFEIVKESFLDEDGLVGDDRRVV